MGDFLKAILDKLSAVSKKVIIGWIIVILLSALAIFPYLDANLFYPNRIKNRIEILDKVTKLDVTSIEQNEQLKTEYDNILIEISKSNDNYVNNFFKQEDRDAMLWKFISGASLWWLFAIIILFYKDKNEKSKGKIWATKIGGFLILGLLGAFWGWIFTLIPIIGNVWVNYIGAPILTIVIMVILFYTASKK